MLLGLRVGLAKDRALQLNEATVAHLVNPAQQWELN